MGRIRPASVRCSVAPAGVTLGWRLNMSCIGLSTPRELGFLPRGAEFDENRTAPWSKSLTLKEGNFQGIFF